MSASAQIRAEIEAALAQRIPSALTPQPRAIRPTVATGIAAIDDLLGGGLPVGAISEIVGPECSGRTTLALAFLASITRQGKACAWVDVSDALHPESAAAAGLNLDRLLWVRCGDAVAPSSDINTDTQFETKPPQTTRVQFGGNSPHPRGESKGLPAAIVDLLGVKAKYKRDRIVGTPGAPNRPLNTTSSAAPDNTHREEQVATDRLPARRGSYVLEQREAYEPRCAEPQHKPRPQKKHIEAVAIERRLRKAVTSAASKPWSRLDQALRVTDLYLAGRRLQRNCSRYGRHCSRICLACAAGNLVPLPRRRRTNPIQLSHADPAPLRKKQRRCGVASRLGTTGRVRRNHFCGPQEPCRTDAQTF